MVALLGHVSGHLDSVCFICYSTVPSAKGTDVFSSLKTKLFVLMTGVFEGVDVFNLGRHGHGSNILFSAPVHGVVLTGAPLSACHVL